MTAPVLTEVVSLPDGRAYPVLIGDGARSELAAVLPERARRVAVVTQAGIGVDVQEVLIESGTGSYANSHPDRPSLPRCARPGPPRHLRLSPATLTAVAAAFTRPPRA